MKKKSNKAKSTEIDICPCGSSQLFLECCGRYLHHGDPAPDAQSLMRSRYTAYALGLEAYLLATWHASTRPASLDFAGDGAHKWIGLEVKSFRAEGEVAYVSFVARYKIGGRAGRMSENSQFVREDGRWFYVDGEESS